MATQLKPGIECSKEEWQARLDLAACYRIFDHLGWSESIYNHLAEGAGRGKHLPHQPLRAAV